MNFPTRFKTGVRSVTIPNPAWLHRNTPDAKVFEGLCSDYNFDRQGMNFIRLQEVLERNGTNFLYVAAAKYQGDLHTNHRFVACAADGSLLWNKYVAHVAQGGQNHVYVGGIRIKVSVFLGLHDFQQDALLSWSQRRIAIAFRHEIRLRYLDESRDLWN